MFLKLTTPRGSRLWDKLLLGAGSVTKSLASKLKDEGYNSESDEEGVDTHVIKALKDYYTQKGQGIPVWLGGTGSNTRPQMSVIRGSNDIDSARESSNDGMNPPSARAGKVSLRGIYEQAAERSASQQTSPRRQISRTGTSYRDQQNNSDTYAPRRSGESARSNTSTLRPPQMSAGERFREKMKNNRTVSSQSVLSSGSSAGEPLSQQSSRTGRTSLEVPRDPTAMASRLKRGGNLSTNPGSSRF